MDDPAIVAKAVYFIAGDETATTWQSMVIQHEGSLWFVATWLQSNDTGKKYPDRIVPMERLPHVVQSNGLIRLGLLMPKELLSPDAPKGLLQQFGAVTHPGIAHIPAPKSTH